LKHHGDYLADAPGRRQLDHRPADATPAGAEQAVVLEHPHRLTHRGQAHAEVLEHAAGDIQDLALLVPPGGDVAAQPRGNDVGRPGLMQLGHPVILSSGALLSTYPPRAFQDTSPARQPTVSPARRLLTGPDE